MSDRGNESGAGKNGIGARLQAARERAGLSVPKAAQSMHVDPQVLLALEGERFAELGAAVYVRGHLRHYAELVKESVPELLALYGASVHAGPPPDLTRMPHAKQENSWRGALLTSGVALVIGVGLIGSVRWIYLDLQTTPTAAPVASAPLAAPAPSAEPQLPPADEGGSAPVPVAGPVPAAMPGSAPQSVGPSGARSAKHAVVLAEAAVTLVFKGACWTEVYDARGTQLFHAISADGDVQTLHGPAPLKVMVGNFAVVSVEINGQAQVIPMDAKSGRVAQFMVTQDGSLQPVQHTATAGNNT